MSLEAYSLRGKVALVTGGGRGIGAAIAAAFAQAGAQVLIANRTAEAGAAVAATIRAASGMAEAMGCDIGQHAQADSAVAEAVRRFGALDIVVHNAAINPWARLGAITDDALDQTLAVNLKACFWLTRAALPHWRARGGGRMLVTSSVTGPRVAMPGSAAYAASKAGVNGFIRSAALELAAERITVNGVEPGYIAKQGGSLLSNPERAARIARHIPAGELGRPEDIALAMGYLASDAARYVTGQTIVVDGGSTLPESPFFNET
ncbi:SDR family oxidoreductase [Aquabacterium sp.]|uniref:SDR family oxidoreductase n=1 Tax=Aquabacterium sp. TaxID=1872578 RepID=UPI002C1290A4|nr:SDR family oxidoreductase [Aquabacterium sp.]HSW07321.1 SDR family oxidoreductase [Aquabacterium sp.]